MSKGRTLYGLAASFGVDDPDEPLPFLQLGDVFYRDYSEPIYLILNASCDLQFVPKTVGNVREANRDATILLLPGSVRKLEDTPKSKLSTGLVKFKGEWCRFDWDREKLTSIPHCLVRSLLQKSGYEHKLRLQMARALEIQQCVFHHHSRIGLEVQPPLSRDLDVSVYVKKPEGFKQSGDIISGGMIRFHTPGKTVLVIKQPTVDELYERLRPALANVDRENKKLSQLCDRIRTNAAKLCRTPLVEPESGKLIAIKSASKLVSIAIDGLGLTVSDSSEPNANWQNNFLAVICIGNSDEQ